MTAVLVPGSSFWGGWARGAGLRADGGGMTFLRGFGMMFEYTPADFRFDHIKSVIGHGGMGRK